MNFSGVDIFDPSTTLGAIICSTIAGIVLLGVGYKIILKIKLNSENVKIRGDNAKVNYKTQEDDEL